MERLFPQRKAKVKKGCRDGIKNCGFHPMGRKTGSSGEMSTGLTAFGKKSIVKLKVLK